MSTVYVVPQLHDLIAQWQICDEYGNHSSGFCNACQQMPRTYRLLVDWQRKGKLKKHLVAELSTDSRQTYDIFQKASPDLSAVIPPPGESKESLADWLIIAWCLRRDDHDRALRLRKYATQLDKLIKRGADQQLLLDLTYVPEKIIQFVPRIRKAMFALNHEVGPALMSHKRKLAKGVRSRFREEQPLTRDQIEYWAGQWGVDKLTKDDSRHIFWTWLFVPLSTYLQPYLVGRKIDSWKTEDSQIVSDIVFETASNLVHLRHPHLWDNTWERVKARCRSHLVCS